MVGCALLAVAACGGDDSTAARDTTTTTATTEVEEVGPELPETLPATGIAEWYDGGTRLRALDGALLADLPGYVVHSNTVPGGPLYVYESGPGARGPTRMLRLDPEHARWVEEKPPPELGADVEHPAVPKEVALTGHWRWSVPSPKGGVSLAQWSGECEVPAAFFVGSDGVPHSVLGGDWLDAPNTSAVGWLPDGRALVYIAGPEPGCGTGEPEPGVYAIDPDTFERTRVDTIRSEISIVWGPTSGAEPRCEKQTLRADVDGDGGEELVLLEWDAARDEAVLSVCSPYVKTDVTVGGMAEYLEAVDINEDGRAELLAGGTTVSATLATVYVLDDDRLVPVTLPDGTELGVAEGMNDGPAFEWTCDDVNKDGTRDLVVRERVDGAHWRVRGIALDGAKATVLSDEVIERSTSVDDLDIARHSC
jgi:hypothetical protein